MAVSVVEKLISRDSTDADTSQVELLYVVSGTDDDLAAKQALAGTAPADYNGLVRQTLRIEPVGPSLWDGTVRYVTPDNQKPETGESSFSFDTGGGTQHITQSLGTVSRYPSSAPDMSGAVGVTHDSVEGVDITIPVYQFSETHYLSASVVTDAYKRQLFVLTGKVNSAAFRGFQEGECLFLGASGSRRGKSPDDDWEITFKFAGSLNATNLTVGTITGINKKGWEYMWVRYQDAEDTSSKTLIKKPVAVYIEKVYDLADFAGLGIS